MEYQRLLRFLAEEIKRLGLTERGFAIQAGTGPDGLRTIRRGNQPQLDKLTSFSKFLGCPLPRLIELMNEDEAGAPIDAPSSIRSETHAPEERPAASEDRMTIGKRGPVYGDAIEDPDEILLLQVFRPLSLTKKAAIFDHLGIDEMPSLRSRSSKRA